MGTFLFLLRHRSVAHYNGASPEEVVLAQPIEAGVGVWLMIGLHRNETSFMSLLSGIYRLQYVILSLKNSPVKTNCCVTLSRTRVCSGMFK